MLTKLGGISPSILMMQTTEYRFRKYQSSLGYGFHLAVCWRFLLNLIGNTGPQGLMRAAAIVQLSNATPILGMYVKFATRGMHGMAGQYGYMRAS